MNLWTWVPQTIVALLGVIGFGSYVIHLVRQTKQNENAIKELGVEMRVAIKELGDKIERRDESLRAEMNQGFSKVRDEINQINQNLFDLLNRDK